MTDRPFRDLCPEADMRDAMSDDEFWEHVANNLSPPEFDPPLWDDGPDLDVSVATEPCPTCGSGGACAYDAEGRPLIHARTEEDDPDD